MGVELDSTPMGAPASTKGVLRGSNISSADETQARKITVRFGKQKFT